MMCIRGISITFKNIVENVICLNSIPRSGNVVKAVSDKSALNLPPDARPDSLCPSGEAV